MPGAPQTFRVVRKGRLIVFCHGLTAPTDEEWEVALEAFRDTGNIAEARVLVFTEGAAPTVIQRGKLNDMASGKQPRIAVLTPSKLARAAGTAIRWFNPRLRVFNPTETEAAMAHLEVTQDEGAYLEATLSALKKEMGVG